MWDIATTKPVIGCRLRRNAGSLILALALSLLHSGLYAQKNSSESKDRLALVIGNSTYLTGPLLNTVNDARAMALALKSSGFEVILKENVTNQNEMKKAVREFGTKLKTGGTALFYYSGHGMQVNGYNYLIPTQAVMNIVEEIEYEALDVGFVLAYMESAKSNVNIVILDACRNNPFARTFRDTKQGLSSMVAPKGTMIAYSTAPGSIASDGEEDYGLYTHALLEQIQTPGLRVEDVFKNVRAEVLKDSRGQQTPWESSSLVGNFYFHKGTMQEPQQEFNASVIPQDAIKLTGTKLSFRWKATPDANYFLEVEDREISAETIYEWRGEHLYVYHEATNRVFILKWFGYRLDGTWRKGTYFE